jgi:hypothetical protein
MRVTSTSLRPKILVIQTIVRNNFEGESWNVIPEIYYPVIEFAIYYPDSIFYPFLSHCRKDDGNKKSGGPILDIYLTNYKFLGFNVGKKFRFSAKFYL